MTHPSTIGPEVNGRAREQLAPPLRILFVVPYVPSRIRVRPYHLLRGLVQRGHAVTLLCPCTSAADARDLEELRPLCASIVTAPVSRLELLSSCLRALPTGMPIQAAYGATTGLCDALERTLRAHTFDAVHVEHIRGAELGLLASAHAPVVYDAVDSISLLFERALRRSPSLKTRAMALLDLARTRRYEAAYQQRFSQILVTSPEDRWAIELLRRQHQLPGDGRISVLPNGVDLDYFTPTGARRDPATLVFSGKMSYHANYAAAMYLVQEIMPLVWRVRSDVKVELVGAQPPAGLSALAADPRVTITGYVEDLRVYLERATIAVCPIRYGVGIQNKVLEALAMGAPVIAAPQAAVALKATNERDILLAQSPELFARQILRLLEDEQLRLALGSNGRHYVEQHHSWERALARLEQCYVAA